MEGSSPPFLIVEEGRTCTNDSFKYKVSRVQKDVRTFSKCFTPDELMPITIFSIQFQYTFSKKMSPLRRTFVGTKGYFSLKNTSTMEDKISIEIFDFYKVLFYKITKL